MPCHLSVTESVSVLFSAQDAAYMARAIRLAERGRYTVRPNPAVGCVIVSNDQVVGEGWHQRAGTPHAEVHALAMAQQQAQGATAYVTLEPCSHHGKTPPCSHALLAAGVQRVVVAMLDPNPLVSGRGVQYLQSVGIQVDVGLLSASAMALNTGFLRRMQHGLPYVRAKVAASLDGQTALHNGESKWITGREARADVQQWRAMSAAIVTGIGTVLADNPSMNVRLPDFADLQPIRVLLDAQLDVAVDAQLFRAKGQVVVISQATAWQQQPAKRAALEQLGVHCLTLAVDGKEHFSWQAVLSLLAKDYAVNDVLIEAGAKLLGSALQANVVDELIWYTAGMVMGDARSSVHWSPALVSIQPTQRWQLAEQRRVGQDVRSRWLKQHKE